MTVVKSERLERYLRVLKLSRKPGREEFFLTLRICLLGMFAVGLFGFIIQLIASALTPLR
ncbi:MAG TPA: protein translocase SEC61 complex subunit gamma [Candidatus Methanomethylia archaeon]|nr:protein translocase SEC61 complex subunit gamma [Candidatus Verstraetearchaeota archaeon]HDI46292.1 protein translocase SEC61 complex subunit gamma [Candidatus Methanomethylicia archaeon]